MNEARPRRIMWLSPMCSLDRRSGAACQMRSVLSTLAGAGWEAHAVQMTLFDGKDPYPVSTIIGKDYARPEYHGKTFKFPQDGVQHHLYFTASSYGRDLTKEEAQAVYKRATQALHEIQPDVVISYGSSNLCKALYREARKVARTMIFYLANPSYTDPALFESFDQVLVPSEFQSGYYREKIGIRSDVLRTLLPETSQPDPSRTLAGTAPEHRNLGLITMINPSLPKGATLFARLVKMAEQAHPEWTFLAVEGRMTDDQWREAEVDLANMRNLWWIPNQQDVRTIYQRSSVLLFPSFWNEASGRSIAEAQLGGIPVLASNHAGMPEQLNGGGFTFDIPERCRETYSAIPSVDEVRPWFETLERLMGDVEFYRESVTRALEAGQMFSREAIQRDVIERFGRYAEGEGLTPPMTPEARQHRTVVKTDDEPGRNDPCPCGSGEKYKKCCMNSQAMEGNERPDQGDVKPSDAARKETLTPDEAFFRFAPPDDIEMAGSIGWLIEKEKKYGGLQKGVVRTENSDLDPRQPHEFSAGYIKRDGQHLPLHIGGDRMSFNHHGYAIPYSKFLRPLVEQSPDQNAKPVIVEIGILRGTGLAIWCDLFPEARVIGLDLDVEIFNQYRPKLESLGAFKKNEPEIFPIDQFTDNRAYFAEILSGDSVDVVIDDGAHTRDAILRTLESIKPYLARDFIYFVEDFVDLSGDFRERLSQEVQCAYEDQMLVVTPAGLNHPVSFMGRKAYLKNLISTARGTPGTTASV